MTAIYAHRGHPASEPAGAGAAAAPPGGGNAAAVPGDRGAVPPSLEATPGNRGAVIRENTVEAFEAARRAGADGVELDVRLSGDGVPVIHHDRRIPDGCAIANIARKSLPSYVPTLEQALATCGGLLVNVEVKHEEGPTTATMAAAVAAALRTAARTGLAAPALPPVLVSSFDERCLAAIAERSGVPTGLLIDWTTDPRTGLARAAALGCATLHPFVTQVDEHLVQAAADAGIGLHVWTVNADADLAVMARLGVAAVITDRVGAAVRIVRNGEGLTG